MLCRNAGGSPVSATAIEVEGLHVGYGNTQALVDVDVDVAAGSTLGVLAAATGMWMLVTIVPAGLRRRQR